MTRRSKRELEKWIEDRERPTVDKDISIDAREGVSAPYVTYVEADPAEGWGPKGPIYSREEDQEHPEDVDE